MELLDHQCFKFFHLGWSVAARYILRVFDARSVYPSLCLSTRIERSGMPRIRMLANGRPNLGNR